MPLQAAAAAKASSRAWKSWPSTWITFQLKAANFLSRGSEGITSAVAPSICRPFTSTMAHRLSRLVLGRRHGGLPHLALLDLAVAQQGVHPVVLPVGLARQGHAHGGGDALAQAAGGHVHPGHVVHLRVAGHVPVNAAELLQPLHGEEAPLGQRGVEGGGAVALGEHKAIPGGVAGLLRVHPHHPEVELCQDVHGGQGAADVARRRPMYHLHRQQPAPGRGQGQVVHVRLFHPIHLSVFSGPGAGHFPKL